jgi:Holliday junction resolvase RusA-like endonuclease
MDAGVYDDDSQVDDLRITRGDPCKDGACIVVIEEING